MAVQVTVEVRRKRGRRWQPVPTTTSVPSPGQALVTVFDHPVTVHSGDELRLHYQFPPEDPAPRARRRKGRT